MLGGTVRDGQGLFKAAPQNQRLCVVDDQDDRLIVGGSGRGRGQRSGFLRDLRGQHWTSKISQRDDVCPRQYQCRKGAQLATIDGFTDLQGFAGVRLDGQLHRTKSQQPERNWLRRGGQRAV